MSTGFKRQRAGALVLGFVVAYGGADGSANGRSGVGAAVVESVGVGIDGVAVANGAGVEGADGVGDASVGVGTTHLCGQENIYCSREARPQTVFRVYDSRNHIGGRGWWLRRNEMQRDWSATAVGDGCR